MIKIENQRVVNVCFNTMNCLNLQVFIERHRLHRNWMRAHCHVRTFEGHTEGVSCVQFDDHRIVSGSHDNTIKVSCTPSAVTTISSISFLIIDCM